MTTGAWRWVDAGWSNDWSSETSHSAPYHCSMCSSENGKGKAAHRNNPGDAEPRGWTWQEAEEFAKVCESMVVATPKFKAKPEAAQESTNSK